MIRKEVILYGIDNYSMIIENITEDLKKNEEYFDIKLILTEALTNAFKHGNNSEKTKPIRLSYFYYGQTVCFEIEDTNVNKSSINIPDEIDEYSILNESGRGLYLIKVLSDEIEIRNNILIIKKIIHNITN